MLVILRENVEHLGRVGDVVKVSAGYARNFLLPRNLVVAADEKNLAVIEHHKRALEKKRKEQRAVHTELAKKLESATVTLARKTGEGDKLFGSVTTTDIAEQLKKSGFDVERRYITLGSPIKALGTYTATVKLDTETSADVKVVVVKEE